MVDLHKGIRAIHNNVIYINGDTEETIIATDINGDEITIDWTQVNAWTDPEQYKYDRNKMIDGKKGVFIGFSLINSELNNQELINSDTDDD